MLCLCNIPCNGNVSGLSENRKHAYFKQYFMLNRSFSTNVFGLHELVGYFVHSSTQKDEI